MAQVFETFTGQVLMALEDFGFCGRGEGGPFVESGTILYTGGTLPINTAGGGLAEEITLPGSAPCQTRPAALRPEREPPCSTARLTLVAPAAGFHWSESPPCVHWKTVVQASPQQNSRREQPSTFRTKVTP